MKTRVELEWVSGDQKPITDSDKLVSLREADGTVVQVTAFYGFAGIWCSVGSQNPVEVNGTKVEAWAEFPEFRGFPPGVSFGTALEALKRGKRVRRGGWGTVYISLLDGMPPTHPVIQLRVEGGDVNSSWLASQDDMLSNDWVILD